MITLLTIAILVFCCFACFAAALLIVDGEYISARRDGRSMAKHIDAVCATDNAATERAIERVEANKLTELEHMIATYVPPLPLTFREALREAAQWSTDGLTRCGCCVADDMAAEMKCTGGQKL